jgi:hypothetical protein
LAGVQPPGKATTTILLARVHRVSGADLSNGQRSGHAMTASTTFFNALG